MSLVKTVLVEKKQTVGDLLKELGLNSSLNAVYLDHERLGMEYEIEEGKNVMIIPMIRGG